MSSRKKAHFIGICGIGMSATASLLKKEGWVVTGSDEAHYPPASEYLQGLGIKFHTGYRRENIPQSADIIVIGRNAKLVPETNEEVRAAYTSGKTIRSYPEVLQGLISDTKNIVVAGSSGKSTCAALIAWILLHAGKNPGFFIGAVPIGFPTNASMGARKIFVLEGDEYSAAHWDATSKFLYYNPHDLLLTAAQHDHVNIFPTPEAYRAPFQTLLSLLPEDGVISACVADQYVKELIVRTKARVVPYERESGKSWHAEHIRYGEHTTFDLMQGNKKIVNLYTTLLGKHNIENIVGASALLLEKDLITPDELTKSVRTFLGIKRRLNLKTERSTVRIYEGFGSSYEKTRTAIEAIRLHFPKSRLIVVFEPYALSWRHREMIHWYDTVFKECDIVFVYPPAQQKSDEYKQLTHGDIIERIRRTGKNVRALHTPHHALEIFEKEMKPDDIVLLLTSGNLGGLIEKIPRLAEEKFPKKSKE